MALQQPQRGKVEYAILSLHRGIKDIGLANITARLEYLDPRIPEGPLDVLDGTACEIIEDHDLADVVLRELLDRMRANQSRSADHEELLAVDFQG